MTTRSEVTTAQHDGYVTLTLNAPERRNALTIPMVQELTAAIGSAAQDPVNHAVVLTGAGTVFCSGADRNMISELTELAPEAIATRVYGHFQGLVRAIVDAEVPIVAAVNGAALGAGCDLALACDCRLVTPGARFEETWIRLGLLPGMGAMSLLAPLVGLGTARNMLYRAESIDGTRAYELGLAEAVTEAESLEELVGQWITPLTTAPRSALSSLKRGTRRATLRFLEDDLDFVSSRQGMRIASDDVRSRLASLVTSGVGR
ncbi:enoyl-CoA hydratase/isomerase family protein [Sporichthya polymorpha]|uniref:enoyl-CoA hydratase/isomerase family protein n=1 Tax=Sporichthya polymorpha TaxID=35751 RepID=UPI00037E817A|nr:enoyl-CoA hydratase/isomerase family protein [Sporichthya polymorpha]